ncbi:MAG: BLUF domain-containing protein [Hyphomicrobiales bacterium]
MYLSRLAYYSLVSLDSSNASAFRQVRSVLETATQNNLESGLTGGLLFNPTYFAQVMEGDRQVISDTFCRIAQNPKHKNIVILDAQPISERIFKSWHVGFAGKSELAKKLYVKYGTKSQFDPSKMTASALVSFISELVVEEDVIQKLLRKR